jgi:hypothetical protein
LDFSLLFVYLGNFKSLQAVGWIWFHGKVTLTEDLIISDTSESDADLDLGCLDLFFGGAALTRRIAGTLVVMVT